jgi:hypothetical protein
MKDFFKGILVLAALITSFLMGFQVGRTKEKAKIPNFQEDTESNIQA